MGDDLVSAAMSTPLFSVVIPTYNRAELLRTTLESVFSQCCRDYEVIVVDDGSSDATTQVVAAYGARICYLRQHHQGPGAARNLALASTHGRYAAFLDSDDLWFPWSLQVYAEVIQANAEPAFVAGKPRRFSSSEELINVQRVSTVTESFRDYLASAEQWRWWSVSSFVIRLDAIRSAGGFTSSPVNGEDADLALKLGIAPGFVQVLAPDTFAYREHPGSAVSDLEKTIAGTWLQVSSERANDYPGGINRALERWRIATRHIRPVSFECLKRGRFSDGWALYCATFRWHLRLFRMKYLLAFPLLLLVSLVFADGLGKAQ